MRERDELLALLNERMEHAALAHDASWLTDPEVFAQAERLAELLDEEDEEDDDVRTALGHLHWRRSRATPGESGDLRAAVALQARFERLGSTADLDVAIRLAEEAVETTPQGHPELARRLSNLAGAFEKRFDRTGTLADLDETITTITRAVRSAPAGHPDRAGILNNLGAALLVRFQRQGRETDLDRALAVQRESVETPPEDPQHLNNLASLLWLSFNRSHDDSELAQAVTALERALELTPAGHPRRVTRLSDLGVLLRSGFERSGEADELERAISLGGAAISAIPLDHPARPRHLGRLGMSLSVRYERYGAVDDLDAAISYCRQAAGTTPADHPALAGHLGDLGRLLWLRFQRWRSPPDLEESVRVGLAAVDALPSDHPDLARHSGNLVGPLRARAEHSGAPEDLDLAVRLARDSVRATAPGDTQRPGRLNNLGITLRARFDGTGSGTDLDEAIDVLRTAAYGVDHREPSRARYLSNLGVALTARFLRSGAGTDLEEAIAIGREAVSATPSDDPDHARCLVNLGTALRARHGSSGEEADRRDAAEAWERAARVGSSAPLARIRAGRAAAGLIAGSDRSRAAQILGEAVELLPRVAPRRLGRQDQQHLLAGLAGLAGDAAALALDNERIPSQDRPGHALTLLETGRAMLMAQLLESRTDLTELRDLHPFVAERFVTLRVLLDQPEPDPGTAESAASGESRMRAAAELELLLEEIRALDGFATFALPPTTEELRQQAAAGAVVAFNVSGYRSDAFIVTADGIGHLRLEGVTPAAVEERTATFQAALADLPDPEGTMGRRLAAQRRIRSVLAWLWDRVTGPVLEVLGHRDRVSGPVPEAVGRQRPPSAGETPWPRIWWVPGGLLGNLPLHAAGHHLDPAEQGYGERTVLDRVVSSYTPTITALRHSRRRDVNALPYGHRTLLVAMPTTPGLPGSELPTVAEEVAALRRWLPRPRVLLGPPATGEPPTRAAVLKHLRRSTFAHFACHGTTDPDDPSRSMLVLTDWQTSPLTMAALIPVHLEHARLAYLSACSTARSRSRRLLDEAIHIASGFQLAGFAHVIGTLWDVDDSASADIATAFYACLTGPGGELDPSRAPYALHQVQRGVRDRLPLAASVWAAHLHTGA